MDSSTERSCGWFAGRGEGCGKITLVESGLPGIDAALMLHPREIHNSAGCSPPPPTWRWSSTAAKPRSRRSRQGVNALDACIATFNGTNALKKHLRDDVRLHGVILDGGTAANIVPERTKAVFSIRARDRIYLQSVIDKVRACAEAGAMMAGCTVEISTEAICAEMNFNRALDAFGRNASSLGHEVLP